MDLIVRDKYFNPYDVNNPLYDGRNQPHISGRRNITTYSIPHQIDPENGGTILGSSYGDGVKITRVEGSGSGFKYIRD